SRSTPTLTPRIFSINHPAPTAIYTLSLHDALPISAQAAAMRKARDVHDARQREGAEAVARQLVPTPIRIPVRAGAEGRLFGSVRSEEHTSELQSRSDLVCRLLLEKKKKKR